MARGVESCDNASVYHVDGPGSVRALTTETGTLTNTYQTDAFGADAQQGLNPQPFGFTGQQVDTDGLVYLRARYYDPNTGRFMSRDPLVGSAYLPLSLNRYTYVTNDPTRQVDPSGRCSNQVCQGTSTGTMQFSSLIPLDPDMPDPRLIASALRRIVLKRAGFDVGPDAGTPIVVDSNVGNLAPLLRADGFNARSVEEIFGDDPGDPAIAAFTRFVNGYVVTNNRKRELQPGGQVGGFPKDIQILIPNLVRNGGTARTLNFVEQQIQRRQLGYPPE